MATTISLTGRLADIMSRPIDSISSVTVKAPSYRPGPGVELTTSQPTNVELGSDGEITIEVVEGVGWVYVEGDGWSDSIRFVAAEGMTTLWEAVVNALPIVVEAKRLLTRLGDAYEAYRSELIELGNNYRTDLLVAYNVAVDRLKAKGDAYVLDFSALKHEVESIASQLNEAYASSEAGQTLPPYLTESALDDKYVPRNGDFVNVKDFGAVGDGTTDDTAAFQTAVDIAGGKRVTVPPGTYVVDGLKVTGKANIELVDDATLFHPAHTSHADMINFTGTHLKIRGGTIDGNHPNQGGIARIVRSFVPTGTTIDVERVHFRRTANVIVSALNFGGYLNFSHNNVTEQKEHNGTPGHHTTIVQVESGEQGGKGFIRTNHNRAVFYDTPRDGGTNPGGFFVAVNGYDETGGGGPLTPGFANGNLSTWEATGNYFYGYGQHYSVNDISPLHTYPSIAGARWTNNYFEACGFSAVSAKSVQDFIFTGNVIKDGMISSKNTNSEGAIAYLPGYQASTVERPRAIISGNIVINPGGQTEVNRQACITVSGTDKSIARDVIISNNILEGGGIGVRLHYAQDVTVSGNQITGGTTSTTNGDHGIVLERASGAVTVTDNTVTATRGRGIQMLAGDTVDIKLSGNTWKQSGAVHAIDVRGADSLSVVGDTIDVETVGLAWMIRGDATGKKLGHLHWVDVKSPHPGTVLWAEIAAASGTLMGNHPPTAVPAAQSGVLYQQLNSAGDPALWVANAAGTGGWMRLGAGGSSGGGGAPAPATANRLLGWNFDPIVAVAGQPAPAAGEVWLSKIQLSTTGRITKVLLSLATGGTDLTYCRLGVYSSEGALIATSNDLISTMSTAGNKYIDLPTPSQLTTGTEVYIGLLWTGATGPGIRGAAGTGIANMGITETIQLRFSVSGSGLTALPSTLGARVDSQIRGWVGVS